MPSTRAGAPQRSVPVGNSGMLCILETMLYRAIIILVVVLTPSASFAFREGEPTNFSQCLSKTAIERTAHKVIYDGAYRGIEYPNGDVPEHVGVCTDLVIRTYRKLGIDLQTDVHEEMKSHFDVFPKKWGLSQPDPNIDHRRVPNLQTLFRRKGIVLPITDNPKDYVAGDLVTWVVAGTLPHIGIVVNRLSSDGKRPLIVHNIGGGPQLEDMLFEYPITGHYRYYGGKVGTINQGAVLKR